MKTTRVVLLLVCATVCSAQTAPGSTAAANPADVKSVDAIMAAVYDVISGPPGPRNWDRFRSLFAPHATLAAVFKKKDGTTAYEVMSPDEYIKNDEPYFLKEGFFENEIARRSENYGGITSVWSTYASRHTKTGEPFERGINNFQLINDGKRWSVLSILWQGESPDNPIPPQYLKDERK